MSIEENYLAIQKKIEGKAELVVVSKTHPVEKIRQIYQLGHRIFGENKVQELCEKQSQLPNDIQWHLIGHLQTNKVKYIAGFVTCIQSVDSEKLMKEINNQAKKINRTIQVMLQVKINQETTKFGLNFEETDMLFRQYLSGKFPNIEIIGLMGLATFTENEAQVKIEFQNLKNIFDQLNTLKKIHYLSMGMSGDYQLAIDCGANTVRIGSSIFGNR